MRIIKIVFVLLFSFVYLNVFAQNEPIKKQLDIGILFPSVSFELPLTNKWSIYGRTGIGAGGVGGVAFGGEGYGLMYQVSPMYNLQGRYYYNGVKSATKSGNPLIGNSGMYCYLMAKGHLQPFIASFDTEEYESQFAIGAGWGIQRAYTNRFVWSFGLGFGLTNDGLTSVGELKLGINLFAK